MTKQQTHSAYTVYQNQVDYLRFAANDCMREALNNVPPEKEYNYLADYAVSYFRMLADMEKRPNYWLQYYAQQGYWL